MGLEPGYVPMILTPHGIEVWYKFDARKEDIIAQVIR